MAQNIFAKAACENSIFKNERYLYPEFVPEKLVHRDSQIDSLVYAFNPVLQGRKPHNTFLYGPTGTGKTACAKFVINSLEEHSDRAKGLYINCFEFESRSAVLIQIANLVGAAIPRRGLATDEIYEKTLAALSRAEFVPIVVLDEIDRLVTGEEGSKLLYDLLRAIEYKKVRFGIVMISNDAELTAKLDARVKSSLAEETLEFAPYSPVQLKEILRTRAEQAFMPVALGKDVVDVAAAHAAKSGGDARIAIESLWRAGREAERENAGQVALKHLRKAFAMIEPTTALKALSSISDEEKVLLKLIAKKAPINSGKLYALYAKTSERPLTMRRIRTFITELEQHNLITAETKSLAGQGKTRELQLAVSKEALMRELG